MFNPKRILTALIISSLLLIPVSGESIKNSTVYSGTDTPLITNTEYAGANGKNAYIDGNDKMTVGFYVSTTGNDSNPGTFDQPFRTISRAQQAVRNYKSSSSIPSGGIAIWIRGGTYELTSVLSLTSDDSGTSADCPVVYCAYQNESVRLIEGCIIDPSYMTLADSSWNCWNVLDESVKGKVYKVNLLDARDIYGNRIYTSNWDSKLKQLFTGYTPQLTMCQNGVPMTLSRYPDISKGDEFAPESWDTISTSAGKSSFTVSTGRMVNWGASPEVYVLSEFTSNNTNAIKRISGYDVSKKQINLDSTVNSGIKANQPYCILNVASELTQPGEFYFDGTTTTVYFIPYNDSISDEFYVGPPSAQEAIDLKSANYVEFRRLSIEGGKYQVVNIDSCDHLTFTNCTLKNSGGMGVVANGTNIKIDYCDIYNLGSAGVLFSGGDRVNLVKANNIVSNCHIHDYAQIALNGNAGITEKSASCCGLTIEHNVINHAPQQGVYLGGNEITVQYNNIYDVCRFSTDAGAVYGNCNWSFRGLRVNNNVIHNIIPTLPNQPGAGAIGVYLDGCLSGVQVKNNVFYDGTSACVFSNGGRDNKIENNIMINYWRGLWSSECGVDCISNTHGDNWNLLEKLQPFHYQSDPWLSAYPELAVIPNDYDQLRPYTDSTKKKRKASHWLYPENCSFTTIIGNGPWKKSFMYDGKNGDSFKYYSGTDKNNSIVDTSALNVTDNVLHIDYSNSDIQATGFTAIPAEKTGITVKSST